MGTGDVETVTALHNYTVGNTPPGAGSALTTDMLFLDGKEAADGADGWLRLNHNGDFASGIFINSPFRIDSASGLDIRDATGADTVTFICDGTDFAITSGDSVTDFRIGGIVGDVQFTGNTGLVVSNMLAISTITSAALNDITDAVNTDNRKIAGAMLFNTTTNTPVYAVGDTDGAIWVNGAGTTAHTPA